MTDDGKLISRIMEVPLASHFNVMIDGRSVVVTVPKCNSFDEKDWGVYFSQISTSIEQYFEHNRLKDYMVLNVYDHIIVSPAIDSQKYIAMSAAKTIANQYGKTVKIICKNPNIPWWKFWA